MIRHCKSRSTRIGALLLSLAVPLGAQDVPGEPEAFRPYEDIELSDTEASLVVAVDVADAWDLLVAALEPLGYDPQQSTDELAGNDPGARAGWLVHDGLWVLAESMPYREDTWSRIRVSTGEFEDEADVERVTGFLNTIAGLVEERFAPPEPVELFPAEEVFEEERPVVIEGVYPYYPLVVTSWPVWGPSIIPVCGALWSTSYAYTHATCEPVRFGWSSWPVYASYSAWCAYLGDPWYGYYRYDHYGHHYGGPYGYVSGHHKHHHGHHGSTLLVAGGTLEDADLGKETVALVDRQPDAPAVDDLPRGDVLVKRHGADRLVSRGEDDAGDPVIYRRTADEPLVPRPESDTPDDDRASAPVVFRDRVKVNPVRTVQPVPDGDGWIRTSGGSWVRRSITPDRSPTGLSAAGRSTSGRSSSGRTSSSAIRIIGGNSTRLLGESSRGSSLSARSRDLGSSSTSFGRTSTPTRSSRPSISIGSSRTSRGSVGVSSRSSPRTSSRSTSIGGRSSAGRTSSGSPASSGSRSSGASRGSFGARAGGRGPR